MSQPRTVLLSAAAWVLLATMGSAAAQAAPPLDPARPGESAPIPAAILGVWALDGRCDNVDDRLAITPGLAQWGSNPPAPIDYFPKDGPDGAAALHWTEEGVVDNFVYDAGHDVLIHNTQGYGMPGAERFDRCPAGNISR